MVSLENDPELADNAGEADSVLGEEWSALVVGFSRRGDGRQAVLRLRLGDRTVAIKSFGRKRGRLRTWWRQGGHWAYLRRSGLGALTRYRVERDTLALWARAGFRVPRVLNFDKPANFDPKFSEPFDRGVCCLVLEWLEGPSLRSALPKGDPGVREERWLREFAVEVGRRHQRVQQEREPALLHQHPILEHVLRFEGGFAYLDLELVSTRRSTLRLQIRRELLGWIRSILQSTLSERAVVVFCESYPDRGLLREIADSRLGGLLAWVEARCHGLRGRNKRPGRRELRGILQEWSRAQLEDRTGQER